jgi:16S rRNA (guanine1207-N2)-methyltransferase
MTSSPDAAQWRERFGPGMGEHYFSAEPGSAMHRAAVETRVWGNDLRLQSASGVFARGRLDAGTAVLFRAAAPRPTSRVFLDLGCGYGVIACALALAVPASEVWAVDVNARALQLAADNAAAHRLGTRVRVQPPDQVPDGVLFDEIWSNPPIRIGKAALHEVLLRWLPRLRPDGRAVLVVSKHLGSDSLQRWLVESGYQCFRLGSAKGFRVLEVTEGAAQPAG